MKIGILTEIINSHSGARAPLEIAKSLANLGNKVSVYGYDFDCDNQTKKDLSQHGIRVFLINRLEFPIIGKLISSLGLYKLVKTFAPDILLFSGTLPFFFFSKLTRIPIVRLYHGTQLDAYLETRLPFEKPSYIQKLINYFANRYIYLIELITFNLASANIAISKFVALQAKTLYNVNIPTVIYHGTPTLVKKTTKFKKSKKGLIKILSVSRITPYKGFHHIIDVVNNIKDRNKVKLIIVGSQPKQKYLNYLKQIGKNKTKIFINPSDSKLAELYSSSNIYVTADRFLYFGLPIIEAAQYSIPSVALDFAAAKEVIVHDYTGFIAKDLDEFKRYLEKLIDDPILTSQMGNKAKNNAKIKFSWNKSGLKYQRFFKKFLLTKHVKN